MRKHIKRIMAMLIALIICVCSYRVPVFANQNRLVVWNNTSAKYYSEEERNFMFGLSDEWIEPVYNQLQATLDYYNVDLSNYDDYIINCDGLPSSDFIAIELLAFKDCNELLAWYSGQLYEVGDSSMGVHEGQFNMICDSSDGVVTYLRTTVNLSGGGSYQVSYIDEKISDKFYIGSNVINGINYYVFDQYDSIDYVSLVYSTFEVRNMRESRRKVLNPGADEGTLGWGARTNISQGNYDALKQTTDYSQYGYGYNGSGYAEYDSSVPAYQVNNELCFDTFLVEKINHPDFLGGTGARVQYSYGDKLFEAIQNDKDYSMKMHFDIEVTYSLSVWADGNLIRQITGGSHSSDVIFDEVEQDIEFRTVQSGSFMYDVNSLVDDNLYNQDVLFYYVLQEAGKDNSNWLGKILTDSLPLEGSVYEEFFGYGENEISINYFDVAITGYVYDYSDNVTMSNSGFGHVDFVSGQNSNYVNTYNPDTGESEKGSTTSGNNYYNVVTETDSGGNTYYNYYYYDTTNNTVTPSVGTVANTLLLTFANPLQLQGVNIDNSSSSSSSGGSGGGSGGYDIPDIVIEDDDYTDTALREDLKDGFGLFDDSETDIKADGYLNMAAAFFNNIDPELQGILTFGISSVVVIGILRSVFRR